MRRPASPDRIDWGRLALLAILAGLLMLLPAVLARDFALVVWSGAFIAAGLAGIWIICARRPGPP